MARRERQLHMQMYPGWNARDNYGMMKKKKRKKEKTGDGGRGNYLYCSFPGLKQGRLRPAPPPPRLTQPLLAAAMLSHLSCLPRPSWGGCGAKDRRRGRGALALLLPLLVPRRGAGGAAAVPRGSAHAALPFFGTAGTNLHLTFPAVACAKSRRTGQVL